MPIRKLIIDADPGIGDALAVVLALLDPDIDLLAVTAVAGTVNAKDATRNVQGLLSQVDPVKWPRVGCATEHFVPEHAICELERLDKLHGPNGMGDCEFPSADLLRTHDSAKLLVDLVREFPNSITLLTLGPLTNVAAALERMPEFLLQLESLVCLGGAIRSPGDATPVAEQNIFRDPEAARKVLRSPATKTLIPLDVTNTVEMTLDQWHHCVQQSNSRSLEFLQQLIPFGFRAHHHYLGLESFLPRELVALAAITRPSLLKGRPLAIDIEMDGRLTRGMTVSDNRRFILPQPNIDVMFDADSQGIMNYLREILLMN